MKTKFVTSYYAYHSGDPFWGQKNRERWYKYSLISICNVNENVVCYTDNDDYGYNQLLEIKNMFNLNNLEIKIFKLSDNPWQERIYKIASSEKCPQYKDFTDYRFYLSPQIYWLKFHFMYLEFEPNINLYWIDCGLSHSGLFAKSTNPYSELEGYDQGFPNENYGEVEFRYYNFTKAFTPEFVKRVNKFNNNKLINLCHTNSHYNFGQFLEKLQLQDTLNIVNPINYPVAGFFGGNSNLIPKYVEYCYKLIEKILSYDDYLIPEQEIMCYLNTKYPEYIKNWTFNTFYHEDWIEKGVFNPETEISFSSFFTKNLY